MNLLKKIGVAFSILAIIVSAFFTYRYFACPREIVPEETIIAKERIDEIAEKLAPRILSIDSLAKRISARRIVLVGETHFKNEPIDFFIELMEKIPDEKLVINLELPNEVQPVIDKFMKTGNGSLLDEIKNHSDCLPYSKILLWCYENRNRVENVCAIDENRGHIIMMRAFCNDTRNVTMAEAIAKSSKDFPEAKIIFYGGQYHMLKAGRYMYDVENRTPAGMRLTEMNIDEHDIYSLLLDGDGRFPISAAWKNNFGAVENDEPVSSLPVNYFFSDPIYGVKYAGELFDFFVNLGELTEIER